MTNDGRAAALQLLFGDASSQVIRKVITDAFPGMFLIIGQDPRDSIARTRLLKIRSEMQYNTAFVGGGSGLSAQTAAQHAKLMECTDFEYDRVLLMLGLI